jgi:hypothetical protein
MAGGFIKKEWMEKVGTGYKKKIEELFMKKLKSSV